MMKTVSKCPKCNETPKIVSVFPKDEHKFQVRCFGCDMTMGHYDDQSRWVPDEFESVEAAIAEWNRRVGSNVEDFWNWNRKKV